MHSSYHKRFGNRPTGAITETLEPRRLLSAGDPDPSWGVAGTLTFSLPGADRGASYNAYKTAPAPGGKLLVAGQVTHPAGGSSGDQGNVFVARLDAKGKVDPTFGCGDGIVEVDVGTVASDEIFNLIAQPDGKVLALTYRGALIRFTADGTLDSTFGGGDGIVQTDGVSKMALAPGGKIVVIGATVDENDNVQVYAARYLPSGAIDKSFGGGGVGFPFYGEGLVVQPDGKVVITGTVPDAFPEHSEDDDAVGIGRLKADGTPDPTFGGGDGFTLVDVGSESDFAETAALDSAGRLVVGAAQFDSDTFYPFRLKTDGSLDRFFTPIRFGENVQPQLTVIGPDGKIVFAGYGRDSEDAGLIRGTFAARYTPDGKLDPSYGGGLGYRNIDGAGVNLLPDGRLVTVTSYSVVGYEPYDRIDVRRYLYDDKSPDLSGVVLSKDGTLTVTGTAGADRLFIRNVVSTQNTELVVVESNDAVRVFARSAVKRVVVRAGAGNDEVRAAVFGVPLKIYGQGGNDALHAGLGATLLDGGDGDDVLDAAPGFFDLAPESAEKIGRVLDGGAGNDALTGGPGGDRLFGGPGADRLDGDAGNDRLDGGTGPDVMFGGDGRDTLDYGSRTAAIRVDLANLGYENGAKGEGDYVYGDFEIVIGSAGDDVIRGNAADNIFYGNAGNDLLDGVGGNDILVGGPGQDQLIGGIGDDRLYGRDGAAGDRLDGGAGFDRASRDDKDIVLSIEKFI